MSEADYTVPDMTYFKLPSYSAAEMIGRQLDVLISAGRRAAERAFQGWPLTPATRCPPAAS